MWPKPQYFARSWYWLLHHLLLDLLPHPCTLNLRPKSKPVSSPNVNGFLHMIWTFKAPYVRDLLVWGCCLGHANMLLVWQWLRWSITIVTWWKVVIWCLMMVMVEDVKCSKEEEVANMQGVKKNKQQKYDFIIYFFVPSINKWNTISLHM